MGKLEAEIPRAPIPPSRAKCFWGLVVSVKAAPGFGAPKGSLDRDHQPPDNCGGGNGSGPTLKTNISGSGWWSLMVGHSLPGTSFGLSPRFYSQLVGPASPLPDGVPRFGGALLSRQRSQWTKRQSAVSPIATVMLKPDASQCFPSSALQIMPNR